MTLEPIAPDTALELYLADKANDLAEASLQSHEYRLRHFVRWCDEQGIENLNALTGRQLQQYRLWRREEGDLSPVSEKTQMDTLRVFVRWLESVDGVGSDNRNRNRGGQTNPPKQGLATAGKHSCQRISTMDNTVDTEPNRGCICDGRSSLSKGELV